MIRFTLILAVVMAVMMAMSPALADSKTAHERLARDLLKELVETDTTHSTGDTLIAAQKMADRLLAAGFSSEDVKVISNAPKKGNLIARLRSPEPVAGPILFLSHIDVVEADPADWTLPPFEFIDQGDYFYGRGTSDDKDESAIHIANLIRMKREGYIPNRDIIVALTADEEGGPANGVQYLLEHHRDLVDADFVINEGGGGRIEDGVYLTNGVQTAEKVYQSYVLEVTDAGGHSSVPKTFNAIYELADALKAVQGFQFPLGLNETTRAFLKGSLPIMDARSAKVAKGLLQDPPLASSLAYLEQTPGWNALFRTTCVATQLDAGHAENALPQRAKAIVNCRVLPGIPVSSIRAQLLKQIDSDKVSVTPVMEALASAPSPLTDEIMVPLRSITDSMWPGVPVVPSMSTGATDGLFFRNAGIPVYGVSGIFYSPGESGAHGRNEKIRKKSFYEGLEFLDRLARALSSPRDKANRTSL